MTITSLHDLPKGYYRMEPGQHADADYFLPQSPPFKGLSFWRVNRG